jgi:hypothetical protein
MRLSSLHMSAVSPWDVDPALQPSRLALLARLAAEARQSALDDARRDEGDTNWGIGCRAYERFVYKLSRASLGSARGWLGVVRDGLSFTIKIDRVVMRSYTGGPSKPELRHVLAAQPLSAPVDARQLLLPFVASPQPENDPRWVWLMAVENDDSGGVSRVVFFQAHPEGFTRNVWSPPPGALTRKHDRQPGPRRSPTARRRARAASQALFPI